MDAVDVLDLALAKMGFVRMDLRGTRPGGRLSASERRATLIYSETPDPEPKPDDNPKPDDGGGDGS